MESKKEYHHPWFDISDMQECDIIMVSQIDENGEGITTDNEYIDWW